jgi:hypothetical protein
MTNPTIIVRVLVRVGTMPSKWQRFTFVESASNPAHRYEIKTDGNILSCACPAWRFKQGGTRDCRHLQEVRNTLAASGMSVDTAIAMLLMGIEPIDGTSSAGRAPVIRAARLHRELKEALGLSDSVIARIIQIVERDVVAPPTAVPISRPAWLGGARAILLRD